MIRVLGILLGAAALVVVLISTAALAVEAFSLLVRPIAFSLRVGRRTVVVPSFHWTVFLVAGAVGVGVLCAVWRVVFYTHTSSWLTA